MSPSEQSKSMTKGGFRTVVVRFMEDRCLTYASALSFSSLLSIVPFLAILFAILKVLDVHTSLTPVILSNVAAGSHEVVVRIMRYISNTRVGSLGVIGVVALFVSVMATLDQLEDAFNQIWRIERGKAVHHKLRDYLIVIFSIPLLFALAVSVASSLQHQWLARWLMKLPGFGPLLLTLFRLVPSLGILIALTCSYFFLPNTRVRFRYALCGGLIAAVAWNLAQWLYVHFQFGVARYNTIYGTLSLLPAFMIWIYTCWVIVLAGMEIVWLLHHNGQSGSPGNGTESG